MYSYITIKTIDGGWIYVEPDIFQKFLGIKYGRKKVQNVKVEIEEDFFEKKRENLVEWLAKEGVKDGLVLWMKQFRNLEAGKKQLLMTLQEKQGADLSREEVVAAVAELDEYLKENVGDFGDLLYFNEQDEKFYWNI